MTITTTLTALGALIKSANPTPQPALTRAIVDPKEWENAADLPFVTLRLSFDEPTNLSLIGFGSGFGRIDYIVDVDIILGIAQTPLPEIHERFEPWPYALLVALTSDMTLGGTVAHICGEPFNAPMQFGVLQNYPDFFGINVKIAVAEKYTLPNVG